MLASMVAPAFAAKPTVVEDVWFVIAIGISPNYVTPGKVWWTGGDTVLHNHGTILDALIARSPTTAGSIFIGTARFEMNFDFDTAAGKGTTVMKVTFDFTDSDLVRNPYGVGTLEGILVAEVTTLNQFDSTLPGVATGFVVATHGTEAFENAKLKADLDMKSALFGGVLPFEFIYFGTHRDYLDNEGVLTYHNPGP